jgi:hypothetical protein
MNRVKDNSGDRKYRVETPQIVWAKVESTYEFTLWNVVKMIAGESGECYLSTEDLATASMMSTGKASQCRKSLIEKGLLEGEIRKDPGYPQPVWHLTIPDLWADNIAWRQKNNSLLDRIRAKANQRKSFHQMKASPDEAPPLPDEEPPTPDETKKNQEEKTKKEEPISCADAQESEPDQETQSWIEDLENEEPPPSNPPHSEEELKARLHETEKRMFARLQGRPWLQWGNQSEEAGRQLERLDGKRDAAMELGYKLENEFGLVPLWSRPKEVKSWIQGLERCIDTSGGDVQMVVDATTKLRRDGLTIKNPWSLTGTVADFAARKRSGGGYDANSNGNWSRNSHGQAQATRGNGRQAPAGSRAGRWSDEEYAEAQQRALIALGEAAPA